MKTKQQRGASVLELMILVPILLLFIIFVFEVGVMFYTLNALNKSTQDAARYMSENQSEFAARKLIAENLLRYGTVTSGGTPLLPNGDTKITSTYSIISLGTHVSVDVSYEHKLFMGATLGALTGLSTGGTLGFGNTFQMGAYSVMRFVQ